MSTEELVIRSLQERTTPEEEKRLRLWRVAAPENDRECKAIAELWSLVAVASPIHSTAPGPDATEYLIARAEAEAAVAREGRQPFTGARAGHDLPGRHLWTRPVAAGLLAASLGVAGLGLGFLASRLLPGQDALAFNHVVTGEGERTTVMLVDGTAVRLGPNSTVRVLDATGDPVIWLEGRAFFGVLPDPSRAFTVRTAYGEAMALGTRFEVRTDEQEFRVLVVEGSVRVSTSGRSVELGEGVMSRSIEGAAPATSTVEDVYEQLEWIGSTFVFRATPLPLVVAEIKHRYGVSVDLEDEALGQMMVTATFTDRSVDEVLFVVCQIVGAGCAVEDGRYRIGDSSLGMLSDGTR